MVSWTLKDVWNVVLVVSNCFENFCEPLRTFLELSWTEWIVFEAVCWTATCLRSQRDLLRMSVKLLRSFTWMFCMWVTNVTLAQVCGEKSVCVCVCLLPAFSSFIDSGRWDTWPTRCFEHESFRFFVESLCVKLSRKLYKLCQTGRIACAEQTFLSQLQHCCC